MKKAYQLKNLFLLLISWFFYSDGYATIATVAVLYGKNELHMSDLELVIVSLIAPLAGIFGALFCLHVLHGYFKLSAKKIVISLICVISLLPLYGIIGLWIPASAKFGGIKTKIEMYIVGTIYGFTIGALGAFSRSLYADLIPKGMESEFFSLYNITDRGSSAIGPILVGFFTDQFHDVRYGFLAVLILLWMGLPFLFLVDPKMGAREAEEFHLNTDEIELDRLELSYKE